MTMANIKIKDNGEMETKRLLLRRLTMDDVDDMYEYGGDPEVSKYVMWNKYESIDDAVEFATFITQGYKERNIKFWAIISKEDNKMIGTINFVAIKEKYNWAEVGYVLNRNYWNKGIMTEALRGVLKFGFEIMKLNKIQARSMVYNKGLYKVMEKVGMIYEGTSRQHVIKDNEYLDIRNYSILRSEYEDIAK